MKKVYEEEDIKTVLAMREGVSPDNIAVEEIGGSKDFVIYDVKNGN